MASVHSPATAPVSNVRPVSKSVEREILARFVELETARYTVTAEAAPAAGKVVAS